MPLYRGSPIGYDEKLMVFRFSMMNRSEAILCKISRSAMDGPENIPNYRKPDRLVQFFRFRDGIEALASDLWDSGGASPDNKLRLYSMTDQQILVDEKAGIVIAEHIEPGHARDPEQTIDRLIAMLDTQEIAEAVKKLKAKSWLKAAKSRPGVR
jgi:hypothetical protein